MYFEIEVGCDIAREAIEVLNHFYSFKITHKSKFCILTPLSKCRCKISDTGPAGGGRHDEGDSGGVEIATP